MSFTTEVLKGVAACAVLLAPIAVIWWSSGRDTPDCENWAMRQQAFLLCVQTPSCTLDEYAFREAFDRQKQLKRHCSAPPRAVPDDKEITL